MSAEASLKPAPYVEELPQGEKFERLVRLLEAYSGLSGDALETHLRGIRAKAWRIYPYGCIGKWNFLDVYVPDVPQYLEVLERVKSGDVLLDIGCCFGTALRQLASDGAPAENLRGIDLEPGFIDLGYELFKDRGRFQAKFYTGDLTDTTNKSFNELDGTVDIIHTASFFHLFTKDAQLRLGERMVKFFKPGANAFIFGRQRGRRETMKTDEPSERGRMRYFHNEQTWQAMWDEIGQRTGTRWKTTLVFADFGQYAVEEGTLFTVQKVE